MFCGDVTGVTCGGKSSIASLLKTTFPRAKFICQDDFYFPHDGSSKELSSASLPNWDSIESIDMVSMTRDNALHFRPVEVANGLASNTKSEYFHYFQFIANI